MYAPLGEESNGFLQLSIQDRLYSLDNSVNVNPNHSYKPNYNLICIRAVRTDPLVI